MPWPSPGDYSAAIQNPRNCFNDSGLKRGKVKTNQLGLPIGASGNFAVVFQIESGGREFAVRCFIRPVTDQEERYDRLSQHLSGFSLPTLVNFAYFSQGIQVHGEWYPVVRMGWAAGQPLHRYVEDHLQQSQALQQLAARWRGMLSGLYGAHMAHGDLQHGNILVDGQGQIRLVDYDGMFIPALQGQPPGEVGHPNYQHPERIQNGYYEEGVDAFSALVIYLSLLALKAEPGLWRFHTEENLIFVANDFRAPGQTPVWKALRRIPDTKVQRLTAQLEGFCQGPVSVVPDLEAVLQRLPRRPTPRSVTLTPAPRPTPRPVTPSPATPPPATIACPRCGQVNSAGEIYCQRCAHQLSGNRWCPHCNSSIPVKARYCTDCGSKL